MFCCLWARVLSWTAVRVHANQAVTTKLMTLPLELTFWRNSLFKFWKWILVTFYMLQNGWKVWMFRITSLLFSRYFTNLISIKTKIQTLISYRCSKWHSLTLKHAVSPCFAQPMARRRYTPANQILQSLQQRCYEFVTCLFLSFDPFSAKQETP